MRAGDWQYSPFQVAFTVFLEHLRNVFPECRYPPGVARSIRYDCARLRLDGDPWLGCWRD